MKIQYLVFYIFILCTTSAFASSSIKFNSFNDDKLLLQELQKGGYSFYFRHSKTIRAKRFKKIVLSDCSTQRNLSPQGIELAKQLSKHLKELEIKIDKVHTSPYCRAKDTALHVFGKFSINDGVSYSMYDDKAAKRIKADALKKLLETNPKKGFNNVVVSHTSNLQDLKKIWLKEELGLAIFKRQKDGSLKHIATINPKDWEVFTK